MPKSFGSDGTLIYAYPDSVTDVTCGGVSVIAYQLVEVFLKSDGWGRVTVQVPMDTASVDGAGPRRAGQKKAALFPTTSLQQVPGNLLDGTTRTYTYWGAITVTP